jgi:hypothetical protein
MSPVVIAACDCSLALMAAAESSSAWSFGWQAVAAMATAAAAVAAAVSAYAGLRASRAAEHVSRDALRALAIGLRPSVLVEVWSGGGHDPEQVIVSNRSTFDAVKLDAEILLRDGRRFHEQRERLRPLMSATATSASGDLWAINLGPPETPGPQSPNRVRRVTIRYSDARLIARREFVEEHLDDGLFTRTDEEISGP